jgi:hypothetical protein
MWAVREIWIGFNGWDEEEITECIYATCYSYVSAARLLDEARELDREQQFLNPTRSGSFSFEIMTPDQYAAWGRSDS